MKNTKTDRANELYVIAAAQQGYFTAAQATAVGIDDNAHPYHVRQGNWIREWRGIYRLARFPESNDSHLVLWSLWARNRKGAAEGIYSHETALSLFEISDVNPAKLHMTVPSTFRRTAPIPEILRLHKGIIAEKDCEERHGYRVVRPLPTILTLIEEGTTPDETILQALRDGFTKGLLIRKQIQSLDIHEPVRDKLSQFIERC